MQDKNVRDMSRLQRRRHSLSARTLRSTMLSCILLGTVALLLGLGLYTYALGRQSVERAFKLARSSRMNAVHAADAIGLSHRVMDKYRALTPEQRAMTGTEEYRALFAEERESGDYDILRHLLFGILQSNNVYDVCIAMFDEENSALVYIVDANQGEAHGPGEWEPASEQTLRRFLDWNGSGTLYEIEKSEKYGWLCTSGLPIAGESGEEENGVVHAYTLVNMSVDNLLVGIRGFALQLSVALVLLTALIACVLTLRMKKRIVEPINAIASAAERYTADRLAGTGKTDHFAALRIHTGDEIENLGLTMADMERDMAQYLDRLTAVTAERERIATELSLATRIQASALPNVFPAFPERREIDLYATMHPAREVGGDFYDFFPVDEDHLCLVIADVSDKGIPAALFMMTTKVILQSLAMLEPSPARILTKANETICAKNPEDMFVTVWLGILELSTGRLTAANAGHEYPALRPPGGSYALYRDRHELPVGMLEDTRYTEYTLRLSPGTRLFVYTDGVPEAVTTGRVFFGIERMLAALNREPDAPPQRLLQNVRAAVDDFAGGAEQFDDLTMLCLEYRGKEEQTQ